MTITNEALQALIMRAYEQGYTMGYNVSRAEKESTNKSEDLTLGDIYEEFKRVYPEWTSDVEDFRPYCHPYASENRAYDILLYMKNGEKKRYSYVSKTLCPIHDEDE